MKLVCNNFKDFLSNLKDIQIVAEDSAINDNRKNIIFQIKDDKVTVMGCCQSIIIKRELNPEFYSVEIDSESDSTQYNYYYYQIRSKVLINYLNTYANMYKTEVHKLVLETSENSRLKCTIYEKNKGDTSEEPVLKESYNTLISEPISGDVVKLLEIELPENAELVDLDTNILKDYTKYLFPQLQSGVGIYSQLVFNRDNVVATSTSYISFFKNRLAETEIFVDMKMIHRVVNILDKLVCTEKELGADLVEDSNGDKIKKLHHAKAYKLSNYIYINTGKSEFFVSYDKRIPDYTKYLDSFTKDNGIELDRMYLKDVLKRLSLDSKLLIEVNLDTIEGIFTVRNDYYRQNLSVEKKWGFLDRDSIKFRITPEVFTNAINGDDTWDANISIYYCEGINKKTQEIIFSDSTGLWFTLIRVNFI